jgi:hypothetical protein
MRTLVIGIALAAGCMLCSCKKTRACECKNANGTYPAGELDATRSQAKKHCKSLSNSDTECYLK